MYQNNFKNRCNNLLPKVNIPFMICDHLMGYKHKLGHRLIAGTVIIIIGITLIVPIIHFPLIIITHTIGVICHGVGVVPWLELILKEEKNVNQLKS